MAKDKRKPAKERRIKVGEWVFTFGKVTGFYGRHHVIVRIGANEYTLLRSELWNPNGGPDSWHSSVATQKESK